MVQIEIDGKPVEVKEGTTVIQAANQLGTYIPHFCYHKKLSFMKMKFILQRRFYIYVIIFKDLTNNL